MISNTQLPDRLRSLIDEQVKIFREGRTVDRCNTIPDTTDIPINDPKHWLRIQDVICIFVDMKGSTQLSAVRHEVSTAGAYQLFTGTAVRLFASLEAPYIDVRGDGVFALFDRTQPYRALAAAVTFKTFVFEVFTPTIKKATNLEVGGHYGIDMKTVLVRKLGLKKVGGRTDRQNEVWAGKPINMAAKLAAIGDTNELHASDRFLSRIRDDHARKTCGCSNGRPGGNKVDLWIPVDVTTDERFDFDTAYRLRSPNWCPVHGAEYCNILLHLDGG